MTSKLPKLIFIFSVIACAALRIYLKLTAIDPATGFYEGGGIAVPLFSVLLGVSAVAMLVLGLLKKPAARKISYGTPPRAAAVLAGLAALVYAGAQFAALLSGHSVAGALVPLFFHLIGLASGVLLIWIGVKANGDSDSFRGNGALLLLPLFWQVYALLSLFMSYTAIRSVSDQMLTVVMLILTAPFLLAHGRVLGGVSLQRGLRQLAAFGLPASLLCLTESAGIIAAALAGRPLAIAPGLPAAVFYLLFGVYAAALSFSVREQPSAVSAGDS